MKYLIVLFLLLQVGVQSIAQSGGNADSLLSQLKTVEHEEKLALYHQLTKAYYQIDLDSALLFARSAVVLAKELGKDSLLASAYLRLCPSFHFARQNDSVIYYANQGLSIGEQIASHDLMGYAYQLKATAYRNIANYEKALTFNQKSLDNYLEISDTTGIVSINNNLTFLFNTVGQFDKALEHALLAQRWSANTNNPRLQGQVARNIADVYRQMGNTNKYREYINLALQFHTRDELPRRHAHLLMNLGALHMENEHYDSTIYYFSDALEIYEELNMLQGMAVAYGNLGGVYMDDKQYAKSKEYLHKSRAIKESLGDSIPLLFDILNLGLLYKEQARVDSTLFYLNRSLTMANSLMEAEIKEKTLEAFYQFYEQQENYEQAFQWYKTYTDYLDEKKGAATEQRIAELETQYESEKKERKIERLALEAEAATAQTRLARIGFGSLAAIGLLLASGLFYRNRKEQKIRILQAQMHAQEKDKMDQSLALKTKQLTGHALHMVQKNKVLQELKTEIGSIAKQLDADQRKALRSLGKRIDFNLQSDEDWKTFRLYFEETNRDFYKNLNQINEALTPTELKLCSLIRLNMNIKETASVLNIEPTSVKTARHRLRKKLGLTQGEDLAAFIRKVA